jgi:SAM-dependent methyltransferase
VNEEKFRQGWAKFRDESVLDGRFRVREQDWHQILTDDTPTHTEKDFSPEYWLHCSWIARKIADVWPATHADFGSYAYFCGIVSAFIPHFTFYDIRPIASPFPDLYTFQADLMNIPLASGTIPSVSCLHVLEHVGLGRYGDVIDVRGDVKAAEELQRILEPKGHFYFVAPMHEKPHVTFNSDRYYSLPLVRDMFHDLDLLEFAYVYGDTICVGEPPKNSYYCGMFVFQKP